MMETAAPARVLIVDDDLVFCQMLAEMVEQLGHQGATAHRLDQCRRELEAREHDLVLLDVGLPDGSGLDLLPWLKSLPRAPEVIIITGDGDADGAELAVTSGAWDYLLKTSALERVQLAVTRALEHRWLASRAHARKVLDRAGILGDSPAITACLEQVAQAAATEFNVLLTGETGVGKELFARAIAANSERAQGPLVVVDCAALPTSLAESLLFGHQRGAFTNADRDAVGLVRQAHGGVLFLDEVGELPLELQKKFLRVLHEKRLRPVGAETEVSCDFRLIAATNQDLEAMARQGRFRDDLLFRLRALAILVPPLRRRPEDLEPLCQHFLGRLADQRGLARKGVTAEFRQALAAHAWPGNVRELQHVLEAAFAAALAEPVLLPQHLPAAVRVAWARQGLEAAPAGAVPSAEHLPPIREYRRGMETLYLRRLLDLADGDARRAARDAGLSLSRFYSLLKEHGLKV